MYYIYPRVMTEVNVSATVGEMSATVGEMSATVGEMSGTVWEMSATVGECPRQFGKCLRQWGNVGNSGEIEYGLGKSKPFITLHRLPLRIQGIQFCTNYLLHNKLYIIIMFYLYTKLSSEMIGTYT